MTEFHNLAILAPAIPRPPGVAGFAVSRARPHSGRFALAALGTILLVSITGCHTNNDLVEDQLRQRENDVRELREEVCRTQGYNDALQRELRAVRQNTPSTLSPELASETFTVKTLVLGRQTGGYDGDNVPGDESLQVVLEPRDFDGHTIKAPGSVQIQALEVNAEGLKRPLSAWQVSPDELRRTWKSGLLSTGYFVILPWKVWPTTDKLRVVAQFTLADGRTFEADKDVVVHLPPQDKRPAPPTPEPLPAPHKMDPPLLDGARAVPSRNGVTDTRAQPAALWETGGRPVQGPAQLLPPVTRR